MGCCGLNGIVAAAICAGVLNNLLIKLCTIIGRGATAKVACTKGKAFTVFSAVTFKTCILIVLNHLLVESMVTLGIAAIWLMYACVTGKSVILMDILFATLRAIALFERN